LSLVLSSYGVILSSDRPLLFYVGIGALIFSETGSFLATDYYALKRHKFEAISNCPLISTEISPPQLVLKGAWGSFLIAFLCVLIVMLKLESEGWKLPLLAFLFFVLSYYEGGEPFYFRKYRVASLLTSVSSTWIPAYFSTLITGATLQSRVGW